MELIMDIIIIIFYLTFLYLLAWVTFNSLPEHARLEFIFYIKNSEFIRKCVRNYFLIIIFFTVSPAFFKTENWLIIIGLVSADTLILISQPLFLKICTSLFFSIHIIILLILKTGLPDTNYKDLIYELFS